MSLRIAFFYLSAVAAGSALSLVADAGGWPTITTILVLAGCGAPIGLVAVAALEGVGQRQVPVRKRGGHRGEPDATPPQHTTFRTYRQSGHARSQQLVALKGVDARVLCYFDGASLGAELEFPDAVQSDIPTLCLEPSDETACQWSPSSTDSGHITVVRYRTPSELRPLVEHWVTLQHAGGSDSATDVDSDDGAQRALTQVVLRYSTSRSPTGFLASTELAALQEAAERNTWGAATIVELLTIGRRSRTAARTGRRRLNAASDWVLLEKRLHLQ